MLFSSVLACLQDQYQTSIESALTRKDCREISVPDFDLDIVTYFVEYLYTRQLPIEIVQNYPVEMWVLGNRFRIWRLTRDLRHLRAFFITEKNVVDLFVKSKTHLAECIRASCLRKMGTHIDKVDKGEMVRVLPKNEVLLLLEHHHPLK